MNLNDNDFKLFGVAEAFKQDRGVLNARWRALQADVHPDRFAAEGAAARRVAMQWALRVNEAYQRLKDPLQRAAYLCSLRGVAIDAENNTAMPAAFLARQMAWREALDEASSAAAVASLAAEVAAERSALLDRITVALDERGDAISAAQQVRALMFVERFAADVEARLDAPGPLGQ